MSTTDSGPEWVFDGQGNLYDLSQPTIIETFGPPPTLRWVAPIDLPEIFGLRCALAGRHRVTHDLRCASEVFEDSGGLFVDVVDEAQWYRWLEVPEERRPERIPRANCASARHLWVEIADPPPPPRPHPLEGDF